MKAPEGGREERRWGGRDRRSGGRCGEKGEEEREEAGLARGSSTSRNSERNFPQRAGAE